MIVSIGSMRETLQEEGFSPALGISIIAMLGGIVGICAFANYIDPSANTLLYLIILVLGLIATTIQAIEDFQDKSLFSDLSSVESLLIGSFAGCLVFLPYALGAFAFIQTLTD